MTMELASSSPLRACCRGRLLAVELVPMAALLLKMVSLSMSEQYYYHTYGAAILQNTSFVFSKEPFCMSSELIDTYTGNNNSYKTAESSSNHLVVYCQIASSVPSIVATIILGPLMDRFGRKIGMVMPFVGATIQGVISIYIISFNLDPYYFIVANFISGVFGGHASILAASFSYVADVTSRRWRSLRVAMVESSMAFGGGLGQFISGYLLTKIDCDYMPPLYFYSGCNFVILAYIVFVLPESLSTSERETLWKRSPKGFRTYMEGFKLYCGRLGPQPTWRLYITTIISVIAAFNVVGTILIDVYFLKALPFDFDSLQIGIFQSLKYGSQGLADIFIVGFFVALNVGDTWILLIGLVFHTVCSMLLGFTVTTWQLYTVAAAKGVEGIIWSSGRGLMSKLVQPEQQGALFSIIASLESISFFLASVVWPLIFPLTLQYNMRPGTTYIFMAALGFALLPLLMSMFFCKKAEAKAEPDAETSNLTSESSDSSVEEYKPLPLSDSKSKYYNINS